MRYSALFFLSVSTFLLSGCSQLPTQALGAHGFGTPLPLNSEEPPPRAVLSQRPMRRQRRNAALGREREPAENAACNGCGGSCDYPVWLYEAEKQNGLYLGLNLQAAEQGFGRPGLPLVFSAGGAFAAADALLAPQAALLPVDSQKALSWGGLFADWCLTRAVNPKTGRPYAGPDKGVAIAETWLHYGCGSKACLGALMVAQQQGRYIPAFCVGTLSVPFTASGRTLRRETIYLGLGARPSAAAAGGNRIGLVAFAAADIVAFRLPQNYQPCKEHFKLEYTPWAEQFREKIRVRQQQGLAATATTAGQSLPQMPRPAAVSLPPLPMAAEPSRNSAALPQNDHNPRAYTVFDEKNLQAEIERALREQDSAPVKFVFSAPQRPARRRAAAR